MSNQDQPLVSVVIAFLNEERFLKEAIESVQLQDYTSWELLLVDDGSTDKSVDMAKAYAAAHPGKIIYCEHEGHINKGLSASRNEGIKQAKGNLVAFLDADDVWLPCKLSRQVAVFQNNPDVAMVAEASEYWYTWQDSEKENTIIRVGAPSEKVYDKGELIQYLYPLSNGAAPCPSGLMVTKSALTRAGGFEESFRGIFQLYEDQAFLHKIYLNERVYVSSDCNNRYRQREGSIVQNVKAEGHYHTVRRHFLEHLQAYLEKEEITDRQTHQLLEKAFIPYHYPQWFFLTDTLPKKMKHVIKRGYKKLTRLQRLNTAS